MAESAKLTLSLTINNEGNLDIVDTSSYDGCIQSEWHAVFERTGLANNPDNQWVIGDDVDPMVVDNLDDLRHNHTIELPGDGCFIFEKLVIPTDAHEAPIGVDYCYYNRNDKKVYFIDAEYGKPTELKTFDEVFDAVWGKNLDNCFWGGGEIFSIFNLIKCFIYLEYNKINDFLRNKCMGDCGNNKNDENLDILLSAITILNYLIEANEFDKASQLLNGLNICGSLCRDLDDSIKGCGCGTT